MRLQSEHLGRIAFSVEKGAETIDAILKKKEDGHIHIEHLSASSEYAKDREVIFGNFHGIGKVTFFDCQSILNKIGSAGLIKGYICSAVIKGHDYLSEESLKFKGCSIDITDYNDWCEKKGYDAEWNDNRIKQIKILDPIEVILPPKDGISGVVRWASKQSSDRINFCLTQGVYINLSFSNEESLDRIVQIKHRIRQILFLLSGKNQTISISLLQGSNDKWYECYMQEQTGIKRSTHFDQVSYEQIEHQFGLYLMNWITHPTFPSIGDLLLVRYNNRYTDLEQEYLSSCFALESIHRRLFPDSVRMNPDVFKENLSQLINIDQLDAEFVKVLSERNKYGYELSFRNRIRQLNKELTSTTKQLSKDDIHKIVTQRNALVHQLEDEQIEGFEFIKYTRIIDNLVRDFLLKRLLSEA